MNTRILVIVPHMPVRELLPASRKLTSERLKLLMDSFYVLS